MAHDVGCSDGMPAGRGRFFVIEPSQRPGVQAPLSWTRSRAARDDPDRQLNAIACGEDARCLSRPVWELREAILTQGVVGESLGFQLGGEGVDGLPGYVVVERHREIAGAHLGVECRRNGVDKLDEVAGGRGGIPAAQGAAAAIRGGLLRPLL